MENQPLESQTLENQPLENKNHDKVSGIVGVAPAPIPVRRWFVTLMCMNIPIIGWIYLMILAFGRSRDTRRDFARAYLLYKLVFILLSLAILSVAIYYGLQFLDPVLDYIEML